MNFKTMFTCTAIAGGMMMLASCGASKQAVSANQWESFKIKDIYFDDKAPHSNGSKIYHAIIPDPEAYINKVAREVLNTLYFSPEDSIPELKRLHYKLEDTKGISAKGGGNGYVDIFYSTRHIERSFVDNDTARVDFETRGVLLH